MKIKIKFPNGRISDSWKKRETFLKTKTKKTATAVEPASAAIMDVKPKTVAIATAIAIIQPNARNRITNTTAGNPCPHSP